jgi:integrase
MTSTTTALVPVDAGLTFRSGQLDEPVSPLVDQLLAGINRAYESHLSPDTQTTYREGWSDYEQFRDVMALQGHAAHLLPESPEDIRYLGTIAMWLVWCCEVRPVVYVCKDGTERQRQIGLKWSTVKTRLAGVINALAERGVPDPKRNRAFQKIVKGLANQYNDAPEKVTALTADLVKKAIDATHTVPATSSRDEALVCLYHHGVRPSLMERLNWDELDVTGRAWEFCCGTTVVSLLPTGDRLCAVEALRRWRFDGLGGPAAGPVFPALDPRGRRQIRPDGTIRRSSKQAIVKRLRALGALAGVALPTRQTPPALTDPAIAGSLVDALHRDALIDVRDRTVLTSGLAVGSRRRNLAEFIIADTNIEVRGYLLRVRRSKTDQDGTVNRRADVGRVGGRYCPVGLMETWLERYEEALGRPLRPTDPLFCRLDKSGAIVLGRFDNDGKFVRDPTGDPVALRRPAFSEIVRLRAAAAGLVGRFTSHSLRRGLATTLARNKKSLQEIAFRGGWKTLDIVAAYIEEEAQFEANVSDWLNLGEND